MKAKELRMKNAMERSLNIMSPVVEQNGMYFDDVIYNENEFRLKLFKSDKEGDETLVAEMIFRYNEDDVWGRTFDEQLACKTVEFLENTVLRG